MKRYNLFQFLLECTTVTLLFHMVFFFSISCFCVTCFKDNYTGKHGSIENLHYVCES